MLALAWVGAVEEGVWLRADRQDAGRGRQGRAWVSPPGNFHGSTIVGLRPGDPLAPTLGFVAAVALADAVAALHPAGEAMLKWPNDLMIDGAKLSGILLERAGDAVVVGVGVNLAHHPDLPDRPTTSLAAQGIVITPAAFTERLAAGFASWLARWRDGGFATIRSAWLARAHPSGTKLSAALPDGTVVEGWFDTLDGDGALILSASTADGMALAADERRAIHAGDVFLV